MEKLILATDLDGTFLGGLEADRLRLYNFIRQNRKKVILIFVTGRGIELIKPLLEDPIIPRPDYVIADVGATICNGDLEAILPLQSSILSGWPGSNVILAALEKEWTHEIALQAVPQDNRCSLYIEDENAAAELSRLVAKLGYDSIYSGGIYFDILPKGVNKGNSLAMLIDNEKLCAEEVIVAGDTLNDLEMFLLGLKGVIVGSAEPELLRRLSGMENIYVAQKDGAGGIIEALLHFNDKLAEFYQDAELKSKVPSPLYASHGDRQLVIVYHRLPFDEVLEDGKWICKKPLSPNGIIPTLCSFFEQGMEGLWVGWSRQSSEDIALLEGEMPDEDFGTMKICRIALTDGEIDIFYKKFSKEAIWPILFSFVDKAEFKYEDWEVFKKVNKVFAERVAKEAALKAIVWIHDYNLWLVPGYLRFLRPDLNIRFFHHTAFPSSDIFCTLPWREEIVSSLTHCDSVGFHIPRYAENFFDTVASNMEIIDYNKVSCAPKFATTGSALGIWEVVNWIQLRDRRVQIEVNPAGVALEAIRQKILTKEYITRVKELRKEYSGRTCILSVDRLDYVKGPAEKLLAFERLLENEPDLHEKVILLNILTPPADGMNIYDETREAVDQLIGRINGRFSSPGWIPVQYFYQSFSFVDILAYYAIADIAWITPLRDGLNLVCKEFIALKMLTNRNSDLLILSEFAGAAVELSGPLLTNPYDLVNLYEVLNKGIRMSEMEKKFRFGKIKSGILSNTVMHWRERFLQGIAEQT